MNYMKELRCSWKEDPPPVEHPFPTESYEKDNTGLPDTVTHSIFDKDTLLRAWGVKVSYSLDTPIILSLT